MGTGHRRIEIGILSLLVVLLGLVGGCEAASLDERLWPVTVPTVEVQIDRRTTVDFRPNPAPLIVFALSDVLEAPPRPSAWHGWEMIAPPPHDWQDEPLSLHDRREIRARVGDIARAFASEPSDRVWMALHSAMSGPRSRSEVANTFLRVMASQSWPEIRRRDAEELCAELFTWATCELEPQHVTTAAVTLASASQLRLDPRIGVCGNGLLGTRRCDRAMERYFSTCFRGREDVGWEFVAAASELDEYHGGLQGVVDWMLR